jgi:hypothetical protein
MNLPSGHRGLVDIVSTAMATPSNSSKHVPSEGPVMVSSGSTPTPVVVERTPLRDRIQMMRSNATTSEVKPAVVRPTEQPMPAPVITPAVVPPATAPVITPAVAPAKPSVVTPAVAPAPVVPPAVAPVTPAAPVMPMVPVPVAPQSHSRAPIGPNPQQLMLVLRNSSYPFQREWAVNELSNVDWHGNPEVVQCLLNSAQKDAAPTVRVACVRALVKMKVDTVPVQMTMQALKADTDPRVQREAVAALSQMRVVETVSATQANTYGNVQPAVAVTPVSSFTVSPAKNAFSR